MLSFASAVLGVLNVALGILTVVRLLHERHARGDDTAVTLDLHS